MWVGPRCQEVGVGMGVGGTAVKKTHFTAIYFHKSRIIDTQGPSV